jgi:hypothetical protein
MKLTSFFPPALRIAGAVFAVWLLSFVSAGSASAGDLLQCKGPNQHSVVACCERETASKKPLWMTGSDLSCKQAVTCGGSIKNRERCRVVIADTQNPSHGTRQSRGQTTSDIRLKTNIHRVGTTVMNLPLYSFAYRGKHGTYIGVMAQDVLKVEPSAVSVGNDGFYRVDYQKLGIEMLKVQ